MPISFRADPQLKPLYAWEERNGWNDSTISFKSAKKHIIDACNYYKVVIPEVRLHATRNLPYASQHNNFISLQRDRYLNVPVSLHEAAHHIVWQKYGARPQDHGPTFLGIYLHLLEKAKITLPGGLRASAKAAKLKWKEHP
jgi:hypothetical protein